MQRIKTILLVTALLLSCGFAYCQKQIIFKEKLSTKTIVGAPNKDIIAENYDLQSFVESIYINYSKLSYKALPNVEKGTYPVIIIRVKDQEHKDFRTKDLKDIPINEVEGFKYENSPTTTAIYGSRGGILGMVTITLKEKE